MEYKPNISITSINSTLDVQEDKINIGYAIFLPVLILTTTVMNMGTIITFWKVPTLRVKPSELLILNLACSDLLTGLVVLPLASPIYITPSRWPFGEITCATLAFVIDISLHGSLFALMTISLDRFLLVYLEYSQYIKCVARKRVYKTIGVGWIFALLTAILEVGLWDKAKRIDATAASIDYTKNCLSAPRRVHTFSLCFFLILYLLPVMLVCGFSVGFLYHLRMRLMKYKGSRTILLSGGISRANNVETGPSGSVGSSPHAKCRYLQGASAIHKSDLSISSGDLISMHVAPTRKKEIAYSVIRNRYIKPGVTLVGLVLAMAICMLPYCFYVIVIESGCESCLDLKIVFGLLLMQFCNACLDPFIYVLTRKRIRMFYRSLLCKKTA